MIGNKADYLIFFLIGVIIGSFLNSCIYRIPRKISLIKPRSYCPKCKKQITWWQNIPLLSYLFLKGRCYNCSNKISFQYPLVELSTGILTIYTIFHFGLTEKTIFYLVLFYCLLIISVIDIYHKKIPNQLLLFLLIFGVIFNTAFKIISWEEALSGGIIAGLILFLTRLLGHYIFKKESLGMGDVKLAVILGFFIGLKLFLLTLFIGSLSAVLIVLLLTIFYHINISQRVPFAPFLCFGCITSLFFISEYYLMRLS
jgi:leader peptidase (prepilin peptidase)/N-methyltransferase